MIEDNDGAAKLDRNPSSTNRTKHFDIRFHFVREKVDKVIKVVHVYPVNLNADCFANRLLAEALVKHRRAFSE